MASAFEIIYEVGTGDTKDSTLAFLPLRWTEAEVTLRRRAPHAWRVTVPRASHHLVSDFVAYREIRIKRDGAYWAPGAGFMGAAGLPGGAAGGVIDLPALGNASCLTWSRGTIVPASAGTLFSTTWDATSVIGYLLDNVEHGSAGDWFPSAGRTISASSYSADYYSPRGVTPLEALLQMCDNEGWLPRFGISTAGAFTFKAGSTGVGWSDLTASVHLYDGGNCTIGDVTRDASLLTTNTFIGSKSAAARTKLNGAHIATDTTIAVDSTIGFFANQSALIGSGATRETVTIVSIDSLTQFTIFSGLANAQADDAPVDLITDYIHRSNATAAASVSQAHHAQNWFIFNDQLALNSALRERLASAYVGAYDHVLTTARVAVTDTATVEALLAAGLEPGDRVKVTSRDPNVGLLYDNTTATVQEMTVRLRDGGCVGIDLTVGDPRIDDLAVLEKTIMTAARAATANFA